MRLIYPVAIHKDPDSCYGVSVPDMPGCISAGDDYAEALDMVVEAITMHMEGMLEDGDPIPTPSRIEDWQDHEDFADAQLWALVQVEVPVPVAA